VLVEVAVEGGGAGAGGGAAVMLKLEPSREHAEALFGV